MEYVDATRVSIDRLKGQIQGIDLLVDPMEKLPFAYQNFFRRHCVCFGRMRRPQEGTSCRTEFVSHLIQKPRLVFYGSIHRTCLLV